MLASIKMEDIIDDKLVTYMKWEQSGLFSFVSRRSAGASDATETNLPQDIPAEIQIVQDVPPEWKPTESSLRIFVIIFSHSRILLEKLPPSPNPSVVVYVSRFR
jgi:hypothetical protein